MESLDLANASPLIIKAHRQLTGYVRNNVHRMDYPTYVRNGWQIGRGRVESACNSVVGCRLKGPGMRWPETGTNSLSHLRALLKSEPSDWHYFWSRDKVHPPPSLPRAYFRDAHTGNSFHGGVACHRPAGGLGASP